MAAAPSVKDIKLKLKKYRYADLAARDIHALITNYKDLKINDVKQFIHPTGSAENLVEASGTIPVYIKGNLYNIPVSIWLRLTHPYQGPLVYVRPTPDMQISPSSFVDPNGVVYLPYLNEWKQGSSDLPTLVQVMCATFAEHCPVYSRRSSQPQVHPPARVQYPAHAQQQWTPPPHQPVQQQPVQPPPSFRSPHYQPQSYQPPPPPQQQQPHYTPAPYPTGTPAGMPLPQKSYPPHLMGYTPPPQLGMGGPMGAPTANPPYPPGPTGGGGPSAMSGYPPNPPYSTPATSITSPHLTSSIVAAGVVGGVVTEEEERKHIEEQQKIQRRSLESAVEDKIRRQLLQVLARAKTEMEQLMKTQQSLQNGSRQLNEMLQEMEVKQREVYEKSEMIKEKNVELESALEYLRSMPDTVDVDEAITASCKLYNQIVQLYAEENAIDDTIYYLGEALRKDVIPLDVYLKHVRDLSRRQFMARATVLKARTIAKLQN